MLALGSVKDLITAMMQENGLQFDLAGFVHNVVLEDLNSIGMYIYINYYYLMDIIDLEAISLVYMYSTVL